MYVSRKEQYTENKHKLYSIIWGQCSDTIQSKLQSRSTFQQIDETRDCISLLKEIKGIMYNFESQQYPIMSIHRVLQKYYNTKQGKTQSLTEYYRWFKTTVDILEHYGANIWHHPSLILKEYQEDGHNITIDEIYINIVLFRKYGTIVKNRSMAFAFIKGAQRDRYGNIFHELRSQCSRDVSHYPSDLSQALRLLSTH